MELGTSDTVTETRCVTCTSKPPTDRSFNVMHGNIKHKAKYAGYIFLQI